MAQTLDIVKQTFKDFGEDEGTTRAAALAYYTVFSLPPLLLLIVMVLGLLFDPAQVREFLAQESVSLMGSSGSGEIASMLENAQRPGSAQGLAWVLSIVTLIFGATGAFAALQQSLNRIWEVKPDPEQGGLRTMIGKRVLGLGMILTIAFLLLVSLVLSTVLSSAGDYIGQQLPGIGGPLLQVLDVVLSLLVITALFAFIFRYLPDAHVAWRDVWVGAAVTAVLFTVGKFLLGIYFGRSDPGDAFGAAGSLALLLVWIYYSAIIVFLGAEFTQAWANAHGHVIEPEEGAVRVVEEIRRGRGGRRAAGGAQGGEWAAR